MLNLLRFLVLNSAVILFVLFEVFCFYLIVNYNESQQEVYSSSSQWVQGFVMKQSKTIRSYFSLSKKMEALASENARLKQIILNSPRNSDYNLDTGGVQTMDTSVERYLLTSARVIGNSISRSKNYLVLDKGEKNGIKRGMGVMGREGVVGIVSDCTEHYAQVLSVLSDNCNISGKLKNSGAFGSMQWDGVDIRYANLNNVPKHVDVAVGEKVVTSGYSLVFPPDIPIGQVYNVEVDQGTNEYWIQVELAEEMQDVDQVYILEFKERPSFTYE